MPARGEPHYCSCRSYRAKKLHGLLLQAVMIVGPFKTQTLTRKHLVFSCQGMNIPRLMRLPPWEVTNWASLSFCHQNTLSSPDEAFKLHQLAADGRHLPAGRVEFANGWCHSQWFTLFGELKPNSQPSPTHQGLKPYTKRWTHIPVWFYHLFTLT